MIRDLENCDFLRRCQFCGFTAKTKIFTKNTQSYLSPVNMQKHAWFSTILLSTSQILTANSQEFAMLRQISEMFEERRQYNEQKHDSNNKTDTLAAFQARNSGRRGNGGRDSGERKVVEMFVSFSAIQNYGCWCAFEGLLPIRGPAQDPIDEFCRKLVQNYDCAKMDFGETCTLETEYVDVMAEVSNPFGKHQDYAWVAIKKWDFQKMTFLPYFLSFSNVILVYFALCSAKNTNPCAAASCAIDADFMRSVFNWLNSNSLSRDLSGYYGFTGDACRMKPEKPEKDDEEQFYGERPNKKETCCGEFPNRQIFMKRLNKKCCGESTYNTDLYDCCDDKSIQLIGTC